MHMWMEYANQLWPVISGVGTLLLGIALLYLRTKFTPVEDHRALSTRLAGLETRGAGQEERLKALEAHVTQAPTRQELQDDIARLAERMAGMEAGLKGVSKELHTTNSYLHSLIDRGLQGAAK